MQNRDLPVAKTVCFQCRGPGFNPWSGELDPTTKSLHAVTKTQGSQLHKNKHLTDAE